MSIEDITIKDKEENDLKEEALADSLVNIKIKKGFGKRS